MGHGPVISSSQCKGSVKRFRHSQSLKKSKPLQRSKSRLNQLSSQPGRNAPRAGGSSHGLSGPLIWAAVYKAPRRRWPRFETRRGAVRKRPPRRFRYCAAAIGGDTETNLTRQQGVFTIRKRAGAGGSPGRRYRVRRRPGGRAERAGEPTSTGHRRGPKPESGVPVEGPSPNSKSKFRVQRFSLESQTGARLSEKVFLVPRTEKYRKNFRMSQIRSPQSKTFVNVRLPDFAQDVCVCVCFEPGPSSFLSCFMVRLVVIGYWSAREV